MSADAVKVLFWGTILLVMAVWGIRKLRTLNRQAEAKPQWQPEWWRAFPEQPVLLSVDPDIPEPPGAGAKKSRAPPPNGPCPPAAGKGGREKEKKRRAGQKQNGKGEGKKVRQGLRGGRRCALASVKNGEKQQRRPQRFWGRLCRKKPVAADGKPTERNAIKDRFYKNPCGE